MWNRDTGMIQKMTIASFATCCYTSYKEYVAHKMMSNGTLISEYLYKYSEGGGGEASPVDVKGGPPSPPYSYALGF